MATATQRKTALRTAHEKLSVLRGLSDEIGSKMTMLRSRVNRNIEPEKNESAMRGLEAQMEVIEVAVDAVESAVEACLE